MRPVPTVFPRAIRLGGPKPTGSSLAPVCIKQGKGDWTGFSEQQTLTDPDHLPQGQTGSGRTSRTPPVEGCEPCSGTSWGGGLRAPGSSWPGMWPMIACQPLPSGGPSTRPASSMPGSPPHLGQDRLLWGWDRCVTGGLPSTLLSRLPGAWGAGAPRPGSGLPK